MPERLMQDDRLTTPQDFRRAVLNILEDADEEKLRLQAMHRATLNILDDFDSEKGRLEQVERATLNILDDFDSEKSRLEQVQRATLNILDDFDTERTKVETASRALQEAFDSLKIAKDTAESASRERGVLLQEVHHRVKNNLQVISSLINMQVRLLEDVASREALEECQRRVQAISLIHEKLYQSRDYGRVPFSEYAKSLAASVYHAMGISSSAIVLKFESQEVGLAVNKAIPCGLILNEFITNALKHGFRGGRTGTICVSVTNIPGGRMGLAVHDNGAGLPPGVDIWKSESLGLQLIRMLSGQIDAELSVETDNGTTFRLIVPTEG